MNIKAIITLVVIFHHYIIVTLVHAQEVESIHTAHNSDHYLEVGFEFGELLQNDFEDLGSSNFTFHIGKRFNKGLSERWGWRFLSIKVDLSNDHLRDTSQVCCIDGNRDNLIGKLNVQRFYLDYYSDEWLNTGGYKIRFIPSFAIGYNYWYLKETKANEEHKVRATTLGANFRLKHTFKDRFFIEAPNIDIGIIVDKDNDVDAKIGEAKINRPDYIAFHLFLTLGYRFSF